MRFSTSQQRLDRFWSMVNKTDTCWLWMGYLQDGYGSVGFDNKQWLAHRLSYTLIIGEIPEGLQLDHLCRNTICVRPQHLEPVTNEENMRRAVDARTSCRRGHLYTNATTAYGNGQRYCRLCMWIRHDWDTRRLIEGNGDTIMAKSKMITHCPQGHEYNERNTYIASRGSRQCRKCNSKSSYEYKQRLKVNHDK
jgi:hypothetical protein